jgi:hypothetical protein
MILRIVNTKIYNIPKEHFNRPVFIMKKGSIVCRVGTEFSYKF